MAARKQAKLDRDLLAAADAGDLARVQELMAAGADPRCEDDEAVCLAAMGGHLALLGYLVESCGADLAAQDGRPLGVAAIGGILPVVKYLVEQKGVSLVCGDADHPGDHAFYLAASHGNLPVVKYLVEERGADPHMFDDECACWAAKCGHLDVLRYFIEEQGVDPYVQSNWLLRESADCGYLQIVRYLIEERGVDPRAGGSEAVVAAMGDAEVVEYLAQRIFSAELWRGRGRAAIEAEAHRLADMIRTSPQFSLSDRPAMAVKIVEEAAGRTMRELEAKADLTP